MAHIYGKSGGSALNVSMGKREKVLWATLLVMVYGAMAAGVLVGVMFLGPEGRTLLNMLSLYMLDGWEGARQF